jgi:hypothetical protein
MALGPNAEMGYAALEQKVTELSAWEASGHAVHLVRWAFPNSLLKSAYSESEDYSLDFPCHFHSRYQEPNYPRKVVSMTTVCTTSQALPFLQRP